MKIDELKASLSPLEAKISELTNVSRGFESFKTSGDECLSKLRKRKQRLENDSYGQGDDVKRASNLEKVALEISQNEKYSAQLEDDYGSCKKEIREYSERFSMIDNEVKHLTSLRDDSFEKMLSSVQ